MFEFEYCKESIRKNEIADCQGYTFIIEAA